MDRFAVPYTKKDGSVKISEKIPEENPLRKGKATERRKESPPGKKKVKTSG